MSPHKQQGVAVERYYDRLLETAESEGRNIDPAERRLPIAVAVMTQCVKPFLMPSLTAPCLRDGRLMS